MSSLVVKVECAPNVVVEVFHPERGPIARGLSPSRFEVEPGHYVVQARLPDGQEIEQAVTVAAGEPDTQVHLRSPSPRKRRTAAERSPATARRRKADGATSASPTPRRFQAPRQQIAPSMQLFHRDELGEWQRIEREVPEAHLPRFEPELPRVDAIAVGPPRQPPVFVPIPGGHLRYFDFKLASERRPLVRLADNVASALLAYLDRGRLDDALVFSEPFAQYAEQSLLHKRDDPVAAAAGAFALLRLGALERLHDWTRNLWNWFPWLPDGLVAYAEHAAQLGEHQLASELLSELPDRGVPALSLGLAMAADRLRSYAATWPENEGLRATQTWITRYALATDFSLPITTYRGRWPDAPEPWLQAERINR
jgi:hypothetical protein